jgi:5-methylcytosine-specific restriction protein A
MARLTTIRPALKAIDTRTCPPPAKRADAALQTAAHQAWRKQVLDRAGWRCEKCEAQGGRGGVMLIADHIVERRDGGAALDPANGRALCPKCHGKKTAAERARRMGDRHSLID